MHFITSVSLASSLIALTGAAPTLTERSINFCLDGQWYVSPELKCSSGFIGCVPQEKANDVCSGQKRFNNDCSANPGLGSFFSCAGNGFKGCTTNSAICDSKLSTSTNVAIQNTSVPSASPTLASGTCRLGEGTFYNCATGFKGCSTDPTVCDPKPDSRPSNPAPVTLNSCQSWEGVFFNCANGFKGCSWDPTVCDKPTRATNPDCPFGGQFFVCAINGFRGCSTDPTICDSKPKITTTPVASGATPKPTDIVNPRSTTGNCSWQKGTQYVAPGQCTSGFAGCTGSELDDFKAVCDGPQRFWSTCPSNSGIYQNCGTNGFVGCTTDVNVCDRKKESF